MWDIFAAEYLDALTAGRDAEAAAYLEIAVGDRVLLRVGISSSIVRASSARHRH